MDFHLGNIDDPELAAAYKLLHPRFPDCLLLKFLSLFFEIF
jgi:hypothetical protein